MTEVHLVPDACLRTCLTWHRISEEVACRSHASTGCSSACLWSGDLLTVPAGCHEARCCKRESSAVKSLCVSNLAGVSPVQDVRTAVLLLALEVLPQITRMASGQFMLRRIQQEAWPIMKRLLQADPLQRHGRPVPGDWPHLCISLLCPIADATQLLLLSVCSVHMWKLHLSMSWVATAAPCRLTFVLALVDATATADTVTSKRLETSTPLCCRAAL